MQSYKNILIVVLFFTFLNDVFLSYLIGGICETYYLFRLFRVASLIFRRCLTKEGLEVI